MYRLYVVWMILLGLSPFLNTAALAAPKAASAQSDPNYNPDYQWKEGGFEKVGFGTAAALTQFRYNQVQIIAVLVYRQDGGGGTSGAHAVPGIPDYEHDPAIEVLGDAMQRAAETEFNRVLQVTGWDTSQRFSIRFQLITAKSRRTLFLTSKTSFVTTRSGASYTIPANISKLVTYTPSWGLGGTYALSWENAISASLVVLDGNKLIYQGDTRNNPDPNDPNFTRTAHAVVIASRFLTNGYTLLLNVHFSDASGQTMTATLNGNGDRVYDASTIRPLMGFEVDPSHISLSINGGAPNGVYDIERRTDISVTDTAPSTVTLDEVGTGRLILYRYPYNNDPLGFFTARLSVEKSPPLERR